MQIDNKYSIDSCQIRIPLNLVKSFPNDIGQKIEGILTTNGQLYSVNTKEHGLHQINGFILRPQTIKQLQHHNTADNNFKEIKYFIHTEPAFKKNEKGTEYLCIEPNSKHLKEKYFTGINGQTIFDIYELIISYGIEISESDFMFNSKIRDIDIKRDTDKLNEQQFKSIIEFLDTSTILTSNSKKGNNIFNENNNLGIAFGIRDKSTITAPFCHFYHKFKEFNSKSKDFNLMYIHNNISENLTRMEFNIPNKKALQNFGINDNKVINLINLIDKEQELISKIATATFNRHIKPAQDIKYSIKSQTKVNTEYVSMIREITYFVKMKFTLNKIINVYVKDYRNYNISEKTIIRKIDMITDIHSLIVTNNINNSRKIINSIQPINDIKFKDYNSTKKAFLNYGIEM
jgi:hypothetical protein